MWQARGLVWTSQGPFKLRPGGPGLGRGRRPLPMSRAIFFYFLCFKAETGSSEKGFLRLGVAPRSAKNLRDRAGIAAPRTKGHLGHRRTKSERHSRNLSLLVSFLQPCTPRSSFSVSPSQSSILFKDSLFHLLRVLSAWKLGFFIWMLLARSICGI